jgi:hypothetical protein
VRSRWTARRGSDWRSPPLRTASSTPRPRRKARSQGRGAGRHPAPAGAWHRASRDAPPERSSTACRICTSRRPTRRATTASSFSSSPCTRGRRPTDDPTGARRVDVPGDIERSARSIGARRGGEPNARHNRSRSEQAPPRPCSAPDSSAFATKPRLSERTTSTRGPPRERLPRQCSLCGLARARPAPRIRRKGALLTFAISHRPSLDERSARTRVSGRGLTVAVPDE